MKKQLVIATTAATLLLPLFALTASAQTTNTTSTANADHGKGRGGFRGGMHMQRPQGVFGEVTAIDGTTLTLASKGFGPSAATTVYTVDAGNATVTKDGAAGTLASVAVGDKVMVQGATNGTAVTATAILDGVPRMGGLGKMGGHVPGNASAAHAAQPAFEGNGQPVVMGTVTAVDGSSLTITNKSNASYAIDASNAKVRKLGKDATLADVAVGDLVVVQGTINGTSVVAASVMDQTHPKATTEPAVNPAAPHRTGFLGGLHDLFSRLFGF